VSDEKQYLLDNRQPEAGVRFDALSSLLNPVTFGHMRRLGITTGWRCWEVGAGGPSVPLWMAEQVGTLGRVLATDIDLTWMPPECPFDVRRHDVGAEGLPGADFDLIHTRLVLVHVPDRDAALARLVSALRPGGWLLVEEADPALQPLLCPDESGPAQALANRLRAGFRTLMAGRGVDLSYGRTMPRRLRELGLEQVGADGYFPLTSPACTELELATVEQIRPRLVEAGLATDVEIDQHKRNVAGGLMDLATAPLISAWGRKADDA
jgi:hypothetical protein